MPAADAASSSLTLDELVRRLADAEGPHRIALASDDDAAFRDALGRLADATSFALHEVDAERLVGEHSQATMGNLRELFDNAQPQTSLLAIAHADILFLEPEQDRAPGDPEEPEDGTKLPIHYLADRMEAFEGVTVIGLHDPAHLDRALREGLVDAVVTL